MKAPILALSAVLAATSPAVAQPQNQQGLQTLTYADLADLGAGAPVVAYVRVHGADRLNAREATTVREGFTRFEIDADVVALIRASSGLPARLRYLVDLPNDSRGRPARIAEASGASPAPRITGIGRAFSVPGNLPGESETQFFLQTADQRPISLSVLRRPGEQVRWSVSLGEIVDEGAAPPQPNTLLWYRLACTLPARLPGDVLSEATPDESRAIQADYQVIMTGLGRCARTRVPTR